MRVRHADRLWMIGGVVAAVVLSVLSWLLFIGPQRSQTGGLNDQAASTELRLDTLRHQLAKLQQESQDLPELRAAVDSLRQALPVTHQMAEFLRELQSSDGHTGVFVHDVVVGVPTQPAHPTAGVYAVPVTLTADGNAASLEGLLRQLQQVQRRGVLVTGVELKPTEQGGTLAGPVSLTVNVQVFVAPKAA
jgi:Tfp pilus assembly protein PilO